MKKTFFRRFLCLALCVLLIFGACGKKESSSKKNSDSSSAESSSDKKSDSASSKSSDSSSSGDESSAEEEEPLSYPFAKMSAETDQMIKDAVAQYNAEDYTNLDEPVQYNVLWLGFTHVTYNELDFQMTDFDMAYLEAVVLNFEKSVEKITNHNLDITVDLHFVNEATPLTKNDNADWLFLAKETVQPAIDAYSVDHEYDTILTTVQTAGDENAKRNEGKEGYGVNYVMLGLETANITADIGYSTFDLQLPKDGTYPLADPETPSLNATAVAVHEWMHQLEPMKTILGIEYPDTHVYQGNTAGYQKYIADENDYDYFEFYKLVLTGKLEYNNGSGIKHVGMYPKMWPLAKRNRYNLGYFTIKDADGKGYLTGLADAPLLTLSDTECVWNIRYNGNGHFALTPKEFPDKLVDLGNAWDSEGNTIGLWIYTGYVDAQSWYLVENSDGSYSIKTPYESGRLLTVQQKGQQATLNAAGAGGTQKWIFKKVGS